jgi:hypothetical protein
MRIRVDVIESPVGKPETFKLPPTDFKVLSVLTVTPDLTGDNIGSLVDLPKAQVFASIKRLTDNGWIISVKRGKTLNLKIQVPSLKDQSSLNILINKDNFKIIRVKKQNRIKSENQGSKEGQKGSSSKVKSSQDKWDIATQPSHAKYKMVHKAIAHAFEKAYAQVRKEAGAPPHYNKNGSQNKYFFNAAMFCYEHKVDPLEYVRFAQEAYSWADDMMFPGPSNISGDWLANKWLSRITKPKKSGIGGHTYDDACPDLKMKLAQAGFTGPYNDGDCRFIESTAKDVNKFDTDLSGVKFSDEITWLSDQLKAGG